MPISDRQIEETLARIRLSAVFAGQEQLVALLTYLVTQERAGLGDRIKAYSVALDMFGDLPDFDPSKDSRVRVAMYRLRAALTLYFATHSDDVPVVIEIPKGGYRPVMRLREARSDEAVLSRAKTAASVAGASRRYGWIIALLLAGLVAAGCYLLFMRPRPILPRIAIESPVEAMRSPLLSEALASLQRDLGAQNGPVVLVNAAADYRVILHGAAKPGCAGYALCAEIRRRDGSVLEWRKYTADADLRAGRRIAAQLQQDIGTTSANLIADFLRNGATIGGIDAPVLRCVIDARALTLGSADRAERDIDPVVNCLKRRAPASRAERFYIGELTAALYIEAGRGYLRSAAQQPFERARRELKLLHDSGDTSKFLLTTELAFEVERPDREIKRVGMTIEKLLRDYPDDYEARTVAASTMAFTLGQTNAAGAVMHADELHKSLYYSPANYVFLIDAMVNDKVDDSRAYYRRIGAPSAPITAVLGFAVGCRSGHLDIRTEAKLALHRFGIAGARDYRNFVIARRYDPEVTAAILRFAEYRACLTNLETR